MRMVADSLRLFIAVAPGTEARDRLRNMIQELRAAHPQARWVKAEQAHLTLAFLGDVDVVRMKDIKDAMSVSVQRRSKFRMAFGGAGAFPSWKNPRVIWLGLAEGGDSLSKLACALRGELEQRRFSLEDRKFHPHLTLCRLGDRTDSDKVRAMRSDAERLSEPEAWRSVAMRVEEVELLSSRLTPGGPVYDVVHRQKLEAA